MEGLTHYQVLGVQPDASTEEIKRAFRKAARHLHPDRNAGVELPQYLLVADAYRVLSDSSLRARYDLDQRQASATPPPPPPPRPQESRQAPPRDKTGASDGQTASAAPQADAGPPAGKVRFVRPRALPSWAKYAAGAALLAGVTWLGWVMREFNETGQGTLIVLVLLFLLIARFKTAVVIVLVAVMASRIASDGYASAVLAPAVIASAASVVLARHWGIQRGGKRSMGAKEARAYFAWGTPGGHEETLHRSGLTGAVAPAGPRATDVLLQQTLADLPGVRVLHAVRLPRSGVVDHLVMAGDKIAVIESQLWPGTDYCWTPYGDIAAGISYEQSASATPTGIAGAVAEVAALTGKAVAGWVLIHPQTSPRALAVRNYEAPEAVRLVAASMAGAQIRDWLSADNDPAVVDLRVLHWGVNQLVHA